VRRLAVEVPLNDGDAAAQLSLALALLPGVPSAAGRPIVVFGGEAATELARQRNVPFEVYALDECVDDEQDMTGPLLLVCTLRDQGARADGVDQADARYQQRRGLISLPRFRRGVPAVAG